VLKWATLSDVLTAKTKVKVRQANDAPETGQSYLSSAKMEPHSFPTSGFLWVEVMAQLLKYSRET
jgi:hypothetical protein